MAGPKLDSIWLTEEIWLCRSHMTFVRLPAVAESCWYAGCCSKRPPKSRVVAKRQVRSAVIRSVSPEEAAPQKRCAWKTCSEPARPRSKYCSRTCSNRNARARYSTKEKKEKGKRAVA